MIQEKWLCDYRSRIKRKKERLDKVQKFKDIMPTVKAAGFCKRDIPTLKQIKAYLKKVKKVSKETLNEVNDSNVVEKWNVIKNWTGNSVRDQSFQTQNKVRQYQYVIEGNLVSI